LFWTAGASKVQCALSLHYHAHFASLLLCSAQVKQLHLTLIHACKNNWEAKLQDLEQAVCYMKTLPSHHFPRAMHGRMQDKSSTEVAQDYTHAPPAYWHLLVQSLSKIKEAKEMINRCKQLTQRINACSVYPSYLNGLPEWFTAC
jgi:hypothetical protein